MTRNPRAFVGIQSKRLAAIGLVALMVMSAGCFGFGIGGGQGGDATQTTTTKHLPKTTTTEERVTEVATAEETTKTATASASNATPESTTSQSGGRETEHGGKSGRETAKALQFTIGKIENCGKTCRSVTATLTNTVSHPVHNVTVKTTISAGDSRVWMEQWSIETLEPGESVTVTKQINIGIWEGLAIKSNNGYVTIKTVITTEDSRRVITNRREVT